MTHIISRRPKSALRGRSDRGQEFGVTITDLDRQRIAALGRWYTLSAEHIARSEVSPGHWHPSRIEEPSEEFARRVYAAKRRLARLARIEPSGSFTGPLVGSQIADGVRSTWYTTPYGATAADLPWNGKNSVNPMLAAHAWMAADVGMQIEALGYRVLSERELASGVDKDGRVLETALESTVIGSNGQSVSKKPDVAVLSRDERTFLAIEVEKWKGRSLTTYVDKLRAYDDNPAVGGVWYLCGSENVANRVVQAAEKVFGDRDYPLRIRVAEPMGTWQGIVGLERDERLLSDLRQHDQGR